MMFEVYKYECSCGWNTAHSFGGSRRQYHPVTVIEKQLEKKLHPRTKMMWEELLSHPLVQQSKDTVTTELPSFLRNSRRSASNNQSPQPEPLVYYKSALCTCNHCETYERVYLFYSKENNEPLHIRLCDSCGEEVTKIDDPLEVKCPACKRNVSGELLNDVNMCKDNNPEPLFVGIGNLGLAVLDKMDEASQRIGFNPSKENNKIYPTIPYKLKESDFEEIHNYSLQLLEVFRKHNVDHVCLIGEIKDITESEILIRLVNRLKYFNVDINIVLCQPVRIEGSSSNKYREVKVKIQSHCKNFITISKDKFFDINKMNMDEANEKAVQKMYDSVVYLCNL